MKMNKHTKLAILIAPFLAIGGYVATDYYDKYKINQTRYHQITVQGDCDIEKGKCLLKGAGLLLEYSRNGTVTHLESNFPLDTAAIAIVNHEDEAPHNLTPASDKKNWTIDTADYSIPATNQPLKIRLIVSANDHLFFSEFENSR